MSRSRNSRKGKKRSPRTYSPAPKKVGNSYKCIQSWCPSGLSMRLSNKKEINIENNIVKKEIEHSYDLSNYIHSNDKLEKD